MENIQLFQHDCMFVRIFFDKKKQKEHKQDERGDMLGKTMFKFYNIQKSKCKKTLLLVIHLYLHECSILAGVKIKVFPPIFASLILRDSIPPFILDRVILEQFEGIWSKFGAIKSNEE